MTALTYSDYTKQLAIMAGYTVGSDGVTVTYDPNFLAILPETINYAELRIQRDLDFLATQTSDSSNKFVIGNNILSVPQSSFITLQTIEAVDSSGNSTPLLPVAKEYIQNVYDGNSTQAVPQYFAMYGSDTGIAGANPTSRNILVGPTPDLAYTARLTGTIRFAPISAANPVTFISTYLPDLFVIASMIYVSAFQRNFGRQSDDPQMAQSYESQYKALLAGAMTEESRKKYQSAAWTSYSPSPVATPTRG